VEEGDGEMAGMLGSRDKREAFIPNSEEVSDSRLYSSGSRRKEVIMTRLRLGHSALNNT